MVPSDTSPDAWARKISGVRALTPQERLRIALVMSDEILQLARDGIRSRQPGFTAVEVDSAFEELLLGGQLARTVRAGRDALPR